jgi:hypothetical protein
MKPFLPTALAGLMAFAPALAAAPAIPPSPPASYAAGTKPFRSGPVLACVGDSECQQGAVSNPAGSTYYSSSYQVGTYANSILGWMNNVSGGAFALDFVNQAYPGNYGGLVYARILTQGSGCPASTVVNITSSTPTGSPANTPATLSFTTTPTGLTPPAGTTFYETVGPNQGSGYLANPTFALSQTCSTPPTLGYALTGSGDWGVNGETTANWLARIQAEVCAAKPDWALDIIGTNDISSGAVSEAAINANTLAGLQAEEACGIRPVLFGINARTIGVGGWTQTMDRMRIRVNAWRRNLAMLTQQASIASTSGLSTYPGLPVPVLYVDTDHIWNDPTQSGATAGNVQANYTIDGLHQSSLGAFAEALAAWQLMRAFVPSPMTIEPNTQNDIYDAANNPGGNILGTVGLMLGTTGTATAPCATSSALATSWQLTESGNASMSCVATQETARTDGLPGQRQIVTISDAGGTGTDKVTLAYYGNFTPSLTAGDQIYLEGDIDLSNLAQVENVGCQIIETNTVQQASDSTFSGSVTGYNSTYPNLASATIAKLNEARNLPDFGLTTTGSFRLHVRTPPITVQSGDSAWTTQCVVYLNGSTGAATATAKFGNFAIRKVSAT